MIGLAIDNNGKALSAFMAKKAKIDDMLTRLQRLSDEHFEVSPKDIHWGHVGDLDNMADNLRVICDRAFDEGEHAE